MGFNPSSKARNLAFHLAKCQVIFEREMAQLTAFWRKSCLFVWSATTRSCLLNTFLLRLRLTLPPGIFDPWRTTLPPNWSFRYNNGLESRDARVPLSTCKFEVRLGAHKDHETKDNV